MTSPLRILSIRGLIPIANPKKPNAKFLLIKGFNKKIKFLSKPNFSLIDNIPSFVPVTFEFGVLCAAHGMAITYMLRNWTLPGFKAENPYPRTTDDRFVMEIHASDSELSAEEIKAFIDETCVLEIDEK